LYSIDYIIVIVILDIYYNLGVVLIELGRQNQALAYLNKALELDPDHPQVQYPLIRIPEIFGTDPESGSGLPQQGF
jgi:tetratricopeptide (TPR) repeat protein